MDPAFTRALRSELVARVGSAPTKGRKRGHRLWSGVGIFVGLGVLGTAGAVAGGLLPLPGAPAVATLSDPVIETHTGSATVHLGPAPKSATDISLRLECLTAGTIVFSDGASMSCTAADAAARNGVATYTLPVTAGMRSATITADAGTRWKLTVTYVNKTTTAWGTNASGQTFGVQNEHGVPDLVAVTATNGRDGYVKRTELEDADGTSAARTFRSPDDAIRWQESRAGRTVSIPVYTEDGKTIVGAFAIG